MRRGAGTRKGRFWASFWQLHDSTRLGVVGLGAVMLVVIIAASSGAFRSDLQSPLTVESQWLEDLVTAVLIFVVVFGVAAHAFARRISREAASVGIGEKSREPWWTGVVAAAAGMALFLGFYALVARGSTPRQRPPAPAGASENKVPVRDGSGGSHPGTDWWRVGVFVVLMLVVAAIVWWFVFRRRYRVPVETRRDAVSEAAVESLDAVLAEPDPRRAVVMAYQRMEDVLGRRGIARERWETPFEYLDRVFAELGAPTAVAATLTELYERAKFGHHPVTIAMRDAAVGALVELVGELEGVA